MTYKHTVLIWHTDQESDRTFNTITLVALVCLFTFTVVVNLIQLPKPDRTIQVVIPERVAKYIEERRKEPIPEPKPQPVPQAQPEPPIQRPTPEASKPKTKVEEKARKSAQSSGLLVLAKELSALADASSINTMIAKKVNTAPANTAAATVDTRILTADTGRKSAGVRQESHVANVGTTTLADNQQQLAQGLLAAGDEKAVKSTGGTGKPARSGGAGRGDEDVAMVMDQHKSTLHTIYNRARRTNPSLKGKIVLVITILPSGQVANIVIKSSELNSPELEASLVARVKQFDFGKRQGEPYTVTVPVEFLPS